MKSYVVKAKELVFPLLLLAAGIGILIVSNDITLNSALEKGEIINARFYPRMVGLVILSVSVFELIIVLKNLITGETNIQSKKLSDVAAEGHSTNTKRLVVFIAIILIYQILLFVVGFFTSTLLFLLVAFKFLGCPSKLKLVLTSVLITCTIYLSFTIALKVYLPRGVLW